MEKKDWEKELSDRIIWLMGRRSLRAVDVIEDLLPRIDIIIEEELSKAREEGYQNCMDDIWEKARGLRSWTEHDGSISATDIEAGLQEAYLEIESKLKDNK